MCSFLFSFCILNTKMVFHHIKCDLMVESFSQSRLMYLLIFRQLPFQNLMINFLHHQLSAQEQQLNDKLPNSYIRPMLSSPHGRVSSVLKFNLSWKFPKSSFEDSLKRHCEVSSKRKLFTFGVELQLNCWTYSETSILVGLLEWILTWINQLECRNYQSTK